MVIGFLSFEIYLPYAHSLKEKRKTLNSLKARLKTRYNVAVAELDFHNKWQRSLIGLVTLNSQKSVVEQLLHRIMLDVEKSVDGEILNTEVHFL